MALDYDAYYQGTSGGREGWRALGARGKADHVITLLERVSTAPEAVLEVGCGDGAVLAELARRRAWRRLAGAEVSRTAAELAREQPGLSEVTLFDGARLPFEDDAFPLVLGTHVLEHVEAPATLLREMRRVSAELVLVEVPLERNLAARRPAAQALSREAGHVQRFDRRQLTGLLSDAGLTPISELVDPLTRELQVFREGSVKGTAKWLLRAIAARSRLAERLMTVHYAVLARK